MSGSVRKMKRMNQNGNGNNLSGGRDLSHLKGGDKAKQAELEKQQYQQNGLMCSCGDRIEAEGIELFGIWKGTGPGPLAGEDLAACVTQRFCKPTCLQYVRAKKDGLSFQFPTPVPGLLLEGVAQVQGSRKMPVVEWFDAQKPGPVTLI